MARAIYIGLAVGTIAAGLVVHEGSAALSLVARDVLGDVLWAMMICWWIGALTPCTGYTRRAVAALALCWAVELSQLYHAPALDAFRGTRVGHLLLGSGFNPRDLVAYAAGVAAVVLLEASSAAYFGRRRATG
jgi:hypothetical protein